MVATSCHRLRRRATRAVPDQTPEAGLTSSALCDADQLEPFVAALGHLLLDLADSGHVVLLLKLRFDRAPLDCGERLPKGPVRHFHAHAEPEHAPLIQRAAGRVILLPVHLVRLRVAAHDDPRLGSVDPSLPGVTCADESAVLEFSGVLPHVPDIALLVLRVPVERSLEWFPILRDRVAHNSAHHSQNPNGLTGYDHVVDLRGLAFEALVMERRARLEWEVAIVDRGHKVRR